MPSAPTRTAQPAGALGIRDIVISTGWAPAVRSVHIGPDRRDPLVQAVMRRLCVCGTLTDGASKCPICQARTSRRRQQHRGTTVQRGYGPEHQALRAKWAPLVAEGGVCCARCGEPIEPAEPWDLGHPTDRPGDYAPEHAARCNRAAAGRSGTARRGGPVDREPGRRMTAAAQGPAGNAALRRDRQLRGSGDYGRTGEAAPAAGRRPVRPHRGRTQPPAVPGPGRVPSAGWLRPGRVLVVGGQPARRAAGPTEGSAAEELTLQSGGHPRRSGGPPRLTGESRSSPPPRGVERRRAARPREQGGTGGSVSALGSAEFRRAGRSPGPPGRSPGRCWTGPAGARGRGRRPGRGRRTASPSPRPGTRERT